MPAKKKPKGEKKVTIAALTAEKKRDLLGYAKCREVSEYAIDLAYNEALKLVYPNDVIA